jgi:rod shape determining protein RodA
MPLVDTGKEGGYFLSQLKWVLLGVGIMLFITYSPNRLLYGLSYILYGLSIIFLVMVIFWGKEGYGATRWLRFGPLGFQPSEYAKVATLLAVSRYLSDERLDINRIKTFAIASALILLPCILIIRQPDCLVY